MVSIDEIARILSDSPLAFKFAILIGFVLIIIAVVPSMSVPILKTTLKLEKNQSIMLGALGGALILGGLSGMIVLSQMSNAAPIVDKVNIDPQQVAAFESGTLINVTVDAKDPDVNLGQKIFGKVVPLQYKFLLIKPETNSVIHEQGPNANNTFIFVVTPADVGKKLIYIDITDRPAGDKDIKNVSWKRDYEIALPNQPPKIRIEDVSPRYEGPQPINKRIKITAEATDPDNDKIYYQFFRMPPPPANDYKKILPVSEQPKNERFWTPNASDIGENEIQVAVQDGDKKGPFANHDPTRISWTINITDKNT